MYKFDEERHVHTLDGKPLHGVTTVLKSWGDPNALIDWAVNQAVDAIERGETPDEARKAHTKKRDAAGSKGTQVHAELETVMKEWIDTGAFDVSDNTKVVQKVINHLYDNGYHPIASEINLYSRTLWVGGIADGIIEKDGKRYILDFKTSGSVQTKYFYQMGVYSFMYHEMSGQNIDGVVIIHIPRGTSFNPETGVYWRYDVEALQSAYLNILNVYKLDQELQKLVKKY